MTMKQPRIAGRQGSVRDPRAADPACTVAVQALCRGALDWRVQGVTGAATRTGQSHIAVRYGRVLLYVEDRAALDTLLAAAKAAYALREQVFGEIEDAFTEAERAARWRFERDGKPSAAAG